MKILALVPAYRRRHITMVCYAGLTRLIDEASEAGFSLAPLIIASEPEDAALAESFGFDCARSPNLPLGRKLNAGLSVALQSEWDYLMTLGSDDLLAVGFFDASKWAPLFSVPTCLRRRLPMFGLADIAIYDYLTGRVKTYHTIASFGAGRFIRRDMVEKTWQAKGFLWEPERNQGLDFSSERMVTQACGFRNVRLVPISNSSLPMVLDIKTNENIHTYDSLPGTPADVRQMDWIRQAFPEFLTMKTISYAAPATP